jgi:hypothetical protein
MSCILLPCVSQTLLYSVCLYSNLYSNASEHQRKTIALNEHIMQISSIKWTRTNACEQHVSSPPFGTLQKTQIFIQQFDYLQYFSDSPKGNQTVVRSSLNEWKLQLFRASRIGFYAYSLAWYVCANVKMSLIPSVHSESCKQEKPIHPTHYPVTESNVYSKVDSKGGN